MTGYLRNKCEICQGRTIYLFLFMSYLFTLLILNSPFLLCFQLVWLNAKILSKIIVIGRLCNFTFSMSCFLGNRWFLSPISFLWPIYTNLRDKFRRKTSMKIKNNLNLGFKSKHHLPSWLPLAYDFLSRNEPIIATTFLNNIKFSSVGWISIFCN